MLSFMSYLLNIAIFNRRQRSNSNFNYKKTGLGFVLLLLSFSLVSCATLQALEPTAVLISDIKGVL
ncbi:hypothetical protein J3492_03085 [Psychrobacter sp. F1192]|uniref:Uncharacterized protein n=1 Tax=Psychrobacter coccoides TaxID=2818440 RepID=A0ABS3NLB3_9GAMM|nr:hypothetical protein [Psychrobacter coccoides]MBO1530196.1 hypothetical protein [Psychrobacter coccoides]